MPYSIHSSTNIFTLVTAPFILIGVLCLSVNLLWCQMCTFYCPLRKKRCILHTEGTSIHIQQHIHQKDLNLCLPLYYYDKVIAELEKNTNKEFNCVYSACNLTKQQFETPVCFWFELMSLNKLFLKHEKLVVLYLGCGCITFNFTTQMTLHHLLSMPMNAKDHANIF